jgi:hypothetical protein
MKKLIIILLLSIPALGFGQLKYLKIGVDTASTMAWTRNYLRLFNPYLLDSAWIKANLRNLLASPGGPGLGLPENTTGETVLIGLTAGNVPILFTGLDDSLGIVGGGNDLINDILYFDVNKYTPYLNKPTGLGLYTGADAPTGTNPLKLNGHFYATKLYAGDIEISGQTFPTTNNPLNIYTSSLANNDFLLYSTANTRWENKTLATILGLIIPSQTGNSGKYLSTNGSVLSWASETSLVDNILDYNSNTFSPYAAFSANNIYLGTTNPTGTTRLNVDRYLYASKLFSGGTEILPHNPVTLGTANGLSLSTQALSLGLSSTSTTGALSNTDWNTFNGKVTFPGFGTTHITAAYGDHAHTGVYQPLLVSGTNIKRINGQDITGSGEITVSATGVETDPIFVAHAANGITASNITSWNNKVSFPGFGVTVSTAAYGNHVHGNYLPFYSGVTNPTLTTRYNVNGDLHATNLNAKSLNFLSGSSTTIAVSGGTLKDFYTDASTSGTAEIDLYSYTIPANVLVNDGDKIEAEYVFIGTSSTGVTIRPYFAGSDIGGDYISLTPVSLGSGRGELKIKIIRVSSSTARVYCTYFVHGGSIYQAQNYVELSSKNWTISNVLKFSAQANVGSATSKMGTIKYFPAAVN